MNDSVLELLGAVATGFLLLLGTVVTVIAPLIVRDRNKDNGGEAKVSNEQVATAEAPDARALRMMLDLREEVDELQRWREENEPRLNALVAALRDLVRKFRARIEARARGDATLPHTDEDMLEEILALLPKEDH